MMIIQFDRSVQVATYGQVNGSRCRCTNGSQRHPMITNAALIVLRRQLLVVTLLKLLVCNYVSMTAALHSHPNIYPSLLLQQQQRSSTTLVSMTQQRHQQFPVTTHQDKNVHRLPHLAIVASRKRQLCARTRLKASIQSPQHLKAQQLLGQSRQEDKINRRQNTTKRELKTLLRVGIPSLLAGVLAYLVFPYLAMTLASSVTSAGALTVLSTDSSQFVQNFLSVSSLLFSILVGQTYYFLYTQQESIYYALFFEVTEAKSLLEQVALVCQGRSMYPRCLQSMVNYVQNDLKQIRKNPAVLLSSRPVDDPLESIMYLTSVGVPSSVYETVKSLREARARRLGALQRKLPAIHMALLWILAAIELISFPLLGAGTQTIGGYNLLSVEGILFGVMTSGIVLTLRVVGELWRPAGGAYNVDNVLSVMVRGLENELQSRLAGRTVTTMQSSNMAPSGARE